MGRTVAMQPWISFQVDKDMDDIIQPAAGWLDCKDFRHLTLDQPGDLRTGVQPRGQQPRGRLQPVPGALRALEAGPLGRDPRYLEGLLPDLRNPAGDLSRAARAR